jgi:glycosyltransferase involved in cell wall biosynthesis
MSGSDVSVVVPLHNGERYVAEALRSILEQTFPPREVIVVDDGSTDSGPAIVRGFATAVRCVSQPQAGLAAALNHGFREASGSLIASLDADDLWMPDKLALQVAAMEADPGLDLVFGGVEQFHSPELGKQERASIGARTGTVPGYLRSAMLATAAAMERVGPFDTRWRVGEFIDWYMRATEAGLRMTTLPELVLRRRLHRANSTTLAGDARTDYARVVKAALDRRRTGATAR